MTKERYVLFLFGLMAVILLCSTPALPCPNCFASTDQKVLHTYYASVIFLSLMPFGILGFISTWLFLHKRKTENMAQSQDEHKIVFPHPSS